MARVLAALLVVLGAVAIVRVLASLLDDVRSQPNIAEPKVQLYDKFNNALHVIVPNGVSKGGTVKYLGTFAQQQQCQKACLSSTERCWHFVYMKRSSDKTYTISERRSQLQLHADDLGDKLVSTRYQAHDGYAKFTLQDLEGGSKRIRVFADQLMLHADDLGDKMVSTRYQNDDEFNHFTIENNGDGSVKIATKASGRFWFVDSDKIVRTTSSNETASLFLLKEVQANLGGECYAIVSPGFNPSYDERAITGSVEWDCRDDDDCSLNGKCMQGTCQCRVAWTGHRCERLKTLPPARDAGYRGVDNGHNTSSWGGAVLKDAKGLYHMWAAEMTEHCGIGAWVQNSRIIHATSVSPGGPYKRKDVTWGVFAHEPEVVPGPNGEYIMYFTANPRPDGGQHGWCNCCREGHGPCDGSTGPGDCPGNSPGEGDSYMSWTVDPDGNWSEKVKIFAGYQGGDTNFAPLILPNGSLVAMWRRWGPGNGGSRQYLATGSDWRDPSTYVRHETELFPDLGNAGTEDQFLYQDSDGNFHAWFHHMYGTGTQSQWWLDATGGHAFSRDGWTWTYTGVSWGDALGRYNTREGQGAMIQFADGKNMKFTRVERPHLVFAGRQLRGDPIYITNSAQYGLGTNPGTGAANDDASYTLVMPVAQEEQVSI